MNKLLKILAIAVCAISLAGCSINITFDESDSKKASISESEEKSADSKDKEKDDIIEIDAKNEHIPTPDEITEKWCDIWVEDRPHEKGGVDVFCDNYYNYDTDEIDMSKLIFSVSATSPAPDYNLANIEAVLNVSDLTSDKVLINFTDDGWGTSGKCLLTHNGDSITCKFYDIVSSGKDWGFTNGEYKLTSAQIAKYWTQ